MQMLWKPWWRVREGREEWPNRNDGKSWPKTKTFLLGSDLLKNNFIRKKARNKRWTWKIKLSTLIIQFQFIFDFLSNEVIFMRTKWQREKNEGKDCGTVILTNYWVVEQRIILKVEQRILVFFPKVEQRIHGCSIGE